MQKFCMSQQGRRHVYVQSAQIPPHKLAGKSMLGSSEPVIINLSTLST